MIGSNNGRICRHNGCWTDQHSVLLVCVGSYFAVRFGQVAVGSLLPLIRETFVVSRGMAGLVLTGMWVVYALVQLPSGFLADWIGARQTICLALATVVVSVVVIVSAPTFTIFSIGILILGLGAGLYYNPAAALLATVFDGTGSALGTHRIGGALAGVITPLVVVGFAGWRRSFTLAAVLALFAIIRISRMLPSNDAVRSELSFPGASGSSTRRDFLSLLGWTTVMMTLVEFVGIASMAFLPTFLVEHFGLTVSWANVLFGVFFAVSAICQPLSGWISDRIGRDATLVVLLSIGVFGYGGLAVGTLAPLFVFLAGVTSSATPVLQSRLIDGVTERGQGISFGLFRSLYLIVGASGSTVVGATADVAGWGIAFAFLSGLLVLALVALFIGHRQ